ncbi:hypothetical protein [Sinomicrobium sp. M5D2P9]
MKSVKLFLIISFISFSTAVFLFLYNNNQKKINNVLTFEKNKVGKIDSHGYSMAIDKEKAGEIGPNGYAVAIDKEKAGEIGPNGYI